MSSFTTIEIEGYFGEIKSHKSSEFLSMYYKIVSVIMNNKNIKESKKKFFEGIMTEKLNEKTISFFMSLITQSNESLDPKTKILIKAITQNEFEFFEVFAHNFKKVLFLNRHQSQFCCKTRSGNRASISGRKVSLTISLRTARPRARTIWSFLHKKC